MSNEVAESDLQQKIVSSDSILFKSYVRVVTTSNCFSSQNTGIHSNLPLQVDNHLYFEITTAKTSLMHYIIEPSTASFKVPVTLSSRVTWNIGY